MVKLEQPTRRAAHLPKRGLGALLAACWLPAGRLAGCTQRRTCPFIKGAPGLEGGARRDTARLRLLPPKRTLEGR